MALSHGKEMCFLSETFQKQKQKKMCEKRKKEKENRFH